MIEPRKEFVLGTVSSIANWNQAPESFVCGCCWCSYLPSDMLVVSAGVSGARRRSVSLVVFNIVFPLNFRCYLVAFCSIGVMDDEAMSSIWAVTDFVEMIVLVFLSSISSALVGVYSNRGNE